jgi:hypothetical protein
MQLNRDSRHTFLISLVACAVGGTASAAVILSLVDFAMTQASVPPISPRAIVWNASASQDTHNPVVEAPQLVVSRADEPAAQNSSAVETPTRVAVVSPTDGPVTQTKAEHPSEVHSHQLRKHSRVARREHHWRRRFTHNFSPSLGDVVR